MGVACERFHLTHFLSCFCCKCLISRVLKKSFLEEKTYKNANVSEGCFSKTAIFQQPVISELARFGVSFVAIHRTFFLLT